jgi:hypothetical protein
MSKGNRAPVPYENQRIALGLIAFFAAFVEVGFAFESYALGRSAPVVQDKGSP